MIQRYYMHREMSERQLNVSSGQLKLTIKLHGLKNKPHEVLQPGLKISPGWCEREGLRFPAAKGGQILQPSATTPPPPPTPPIFHVRQCLSKNLLMFIFSRLLDAQTAMLVEFTKKFEKYEEELEIVEREKVGKMQIVAMSGEKGANQSQAKERDLILVMFVLLRMNVLNYLGHKWLYESTIDNLLLIYIF